MCLQLARKLLSPRQTYRLSARLSPGHEGPVNCFAIIGDAELLASGGDDELVHIWDLGKSERRETLSDVGGRRGQITSLLWIRDANGLPENGVLCVGTGRGRLIAYQLQRKRDRSQFLLTSDAAVFPPGDSLEALAFDPTHRRLVATSHNGTIKMFCLDKEGSPVELWKVDQGEGIPRFVHFLNQGEDVFVYALESGEISCWDAQTAALKISKRLKGSVGNADVDEYKKNIVVDNMATGLDLYPVGRSSVTQSFEIPTRQKYVKAAAFCEYGTAVVGGSDHGKIYFFGIKSPGANQILTQGTFKSLIQALATASSDDHHILVGGSSDEKSDICVWKKPTKNTIQRKLKERERFVEACIGAAFVYLVLVWVLSRFPTAKEGLAEAPSALRNLMAKNADLQKQHELEILARLGDSLLNLEARMSREREEAIVAQFTDTENMYQGKCSSERIVF